LSEPSVTGAYSAGSWIENPDSKEGRNPVDPEGRSASGAINPEDWARSFQLHLAIGGLSFQLDTGG
jgi:hypothetical protein